MYRIWLLNIFIKFHGSISLTFWYRNTRRNTGRDQYKNWVCQSIHWLIYGQISHLWKSTQGWMYLRWQSNYKYSSIKFTLFTFWLRCFTHQLTFLQETLWVDRSIWTNKSLALKHTLNTQCWQMQNIQTIYALS